MQSSLLGKYGANHIEVFFENDYSDVQVINIIELIQGLREVGFVAQITKNEAEGIDKEERKQMG